MQTNAQEFYRFAARVLGVEAVDESTAYGSIPEWDSIQHLRLVMETQSRYGIDIPLEKIPSLHTISDFLNLLNQP